MGGWRDLCQKLRMDERERGNTRDREELLVMQVGEAGVVAREERYGERNARSKARKGINYEMKDMGKERERERGGGGGVGITYCRGGVNRDIGRIGKSWYH